MLTPGLTSGRMKIMFQVIKDVNINFIKFIENHPKASTDGIETRSLTKRLTLDYVAKAAFGIDGKSFDSYEDISEFNKLANQFLKPGGLVAIIMGLSQIFPGMLKLLTLKCFIRDVEKKLVEIISDVINYRKKNNSKGNDYLQFLIDLGIEKNLPYSEITAHASTLFLDGYETSSLALSFLLLNLAQHPEYQKKIREEIIKYVKNDKNGELTYEAVHEMPWLNACFYESLRVSPVADVSVKLCTEPFEYTPSNSDFKQITVKLVPGDTVILPYALTSTDEKYFEEANKFKPERMFSRDSFEKSAYFPFGDGPRACIGQRLGIMQVKLGAVSVLRNFELSVSTKLKQPIQYVPYYFLNEIKGGIWIRYKKI